MHMHTRIQIHMHTCMHTRMHTRKQIHMHTCMHMHMHWVQVGHVGGCRLVSSGVPSPAHSRLHVCRVDRLHGAAGCSAWRTCGAAWRDASSTKRLVWATSTIESCGEYCTCVNTSCTRACDVTAPTRVVGARSAHGLRMVCTWCARVVCAWSAGCMRGRGHGLCFALDALCIVSAGHVQGTCRARAGRASCASCCARRARLVLLVGLGQRVPPGALRFGQAELQPLEAAHASRVLGMLKLTQLVEAAPDNRDGQHRVNTEQCSALSKQARQRLRSASPAQLPMDAGFVSSRCSRAAALSSTASAPPHASGCSATMAVCTARHCGDVHSACGHVWCGAHAARPKGV